MVQQTTDKFNQYRLVNSRVSMPSGEGQQPIALKRVAFREQPHETWNVPMKSPKNSPLTKDEGPISDTTKVSGMKRQHPTSPSSARTFLPNNIGQPLVYVRRKHEPEAAKVIARRNVDVADSQASSKYGNDGNGEPKVQHVPPQESKVSSSEILAPLPPATPNTSQGQPSAVLSHGKPSEQVVPEPNHPSIMNGIAAQPSPQRPSNQDWKERFLRLQTFLKNCDQANQEYMQKLRSLSAADRSRHAVILEKRAIQLLLEEGQELQRMKDLNVLGKASTTNQTTPVSAQTHSSMATVSQAHSLLQTVRGK